MSRMEVAHCQRRQASHSMALEHRVKAVDSLILIALLHRDRTAPNHCTYKNKNSAQPHDAFLLRSANQAAK